MKIELLRKREDFEVIFRDSLSKFIGNYLGDVCQVVQGDGLCNKFLVNEYLNLIYPATIKRNQLTTLTQEFLWNESFYRRLLQKIYVYFAVRWPFEIFARSNVLSISGCSTSLHGWVFIPGNHSIRIIDLVNNQCIVFYKQGFNKSFFLMDVEVREKYLLPYVPKIIDKNIENGWYKEDRITGLPLNRLRCVEDRGRAFGKACESLRYLYAKKITYHRLDDYLSTVSDKIETVLKSSFVEIPHDSYHQIKCVKSWLEDVLKEYANKEVVTVLTHGDFQPANILYDVESEDCWLIDWEYASARSVFYDALVFDLQARANRGLSKRFAGYLSELEGGEVFCAWTQFSLTENNSYYLTLFMLEDLLVKLEEVAVPAIANKLGSLKPWLDEVISIQRSLLKSEYN